MTNALRLCLAVVVCLFLPSCKMDYSAIRMGPPQVPVAHLVGGLNRLDGTQVIIKKVNGKNVGTNVNGREMLIPAGTNTLQMFYLNGLALSKVDFTSDFEAGGYYIAEVYPYESEKIARFVLTRVSPQDFQTFMCRAQGDLQERLKNVNPQPAPACDAIKAARMQSVQPQPKPQQSWNGFKSIGK
ncbi:hypothetical protein [Stenotrophomonas sp. PS02289]|uniref:hypothetical protein n=1 Tax=Stenotrophomonas sp. PS02289 TaxID=2991422 RepID=UPI00249B1E23|nr:hypothetical protein [Stenotrophomonas sp. PS02289]